MCVDAEGNLWVAIWGAGEVRCFSPDAELLAVVDVPAPNTSCVAFVGPNLDTLLITTRPSSCRTARSASIPTREDFSPCRWEPSAYRRPTGPTPTDPDPTHQTGNHFWQISSRRREFEESECFMYLMRIGSPGAEKPVVRIDERSYVDVSDVVTDFNEAFFGTGPEELTALAALAATRTEAGQVHEFAGERIGAPIARPHQILCIGLNYSDHAAETGQAVPAEPILFTKSPNTLVGPNDDVRIPRGSTKTDWEVELGIVIGRRSSYLEDEEQAKAAIAGYVVVNDVSERAFQIERSGQWSKGKSAETFNPAGPWLVTPDEIDDVLDLDMKLSVNGQVRQDGSTKTMVFNRTSSCIT